MIPRPYQIEAHEAARATWEHTPGALLVMATGTGKTLTALALCVADFLARGRRVVWLAHREELLDQPLRNMLDHWPEISAGIVQADRDTPEAAIVFASVATLATSPHRVDAILSHGSPALVIVDEAHHAVSPTHRAAIESLGAPLRLGLTATPHREDGGDLSQEWEIAYSYGTADAIRDGYLVDPWAVVSMVPDLHLEEIGGRRDYNDADLAVELLRAGVVDHTVAMMRETHVCTRLPSRDSEQPLTARGRGALVFCASIEQARLTAEALRADGWRARHISGKTPKADRRRLIRAFREGLIDVLCNAAVLTEGTDLPRASCVVLARPTRSWSLYVQMVGRGLRLHPGKSEAVILDLAGATEVHSLISAPVLIGGSECRRSPDLVHAYQQTESGGGQCEHCGGRVSCWENMGAHTWGEDHRCTACGAARCPESDTLDHQWTPVEGYKRQCLYCRVEVPDPLAGLLAERKRRPDAVEADWVRVPRVTPETYAVDCGKHGILFVTGDRGSGMWRPIWLRYRARKPRPLTSEPIPSEYVRAYADDIVTRAAKVAGAGVGWKRALPTENHRRYAERHGVTWQGETAGELARRAFKVRARERGIACGVCDGE